MSESKESKAIPGSASAQFVSGSTSASAAGAGSAAASSAAVDSATAIAAATEAVKKAKASILTISSTKFALDDVALVLHSALAFPLAFPKEAAASESKSGSSSGAGAAGSSESKETKKQSTGSRRPRLLEADMTCPACCDFLFRPVTVSCGHSYCEPCIVRIKEQKSTKPVCVRPNCQQIIAAKDGRSGCVALTAALDTCFPMEYKVAKLRTSATGLSAKNQHKEAAAALTQCMQLCAELGASSSASSAGSAAGSSGSAGAAGSSSSAETASGKARPRLALLRGRAAALLTAGEYKAALEDCAAISQRSPLQSAPYALRASVELATKAPAKALASFTMALVLETEPASRKDLAHQMAGTLLRLPKDELKAFPLEQVWAEAVTAVRAALAKSKHPLGYIGRRRLIDAPKPSAVSKELQCLLCMTVLFEPVTTVCGHTFCRQCLARSLDHKNLCPFCRASLSEHISPKRQPINVAMRAVLQKWCPKAYERRRVALKAELDEQALFLPIFVCSLMMPGIPCPLHIFEPRYRLMIRSVMESGFHRFGMCVSTDHTGSFAQVGTTAEVRSVELLPDGRSLIDTVGGRRFQVLERSQRNGYNVARVEWLDDLPEDKQAAMFADATPPLAELIQTVHNITKTQFYNRLPGFVRLRIEQQYGPMPDITQNASHFAYWLCSLLPISMQFKYEFLQLTTQRERYVRLMVVLGKLVESAAAAGAGAGGDGDNGAGDEGEQEEPEEEDTDMVAGGAGAGSGGAGAGTA